MSNYFEERNKAMKQIYGYDPEAPQLISIDEASELIYTSDEFEIRNVKERGNKKEQVYLKLYAKPQTKSNVVCRFNPFTGEVDMRHSNSSEKGERKKNDSKLSKKFLDYLDAPADKNKFSGMTVKEAIIKSMKTLYDLDIKEDDFIESNDEITIKK